MKPNNPGKKKDNAKKEEEDVVVMEESNPKNRNDGKDGIAEKGKGTFKLINEEPSNIHINPLHIKSSDVSKLENAKSSKKRRRNRNKKTDILKNDDENIPCISKVFGTQCKLATLLRKVKLLD